MAQTKEEKALREREEGRRCPHCNCCRRMCHHTTADGQYCICLEYAIADDISRDEFNTFCKEGTP